MLSKVAILIGVAAAAVASPICFDPQRDGFSSLQMTFKRPAAASYNPPESRCTSLKPGRYHIRSRVDGEFVQASWLKRPLTWDLEKEGEGFKFKSVALSGIIEGQVFATVGHGQPFSAVTPEEEREVRPTIFKIEDGQEGSCFIRSVDERSCSWDLVDGHSPFARIDCDNFEGPAHEYELLPLDREIEQSESCVKPGKYKLLSLTNGYLRVTGPGKPVVTRATRDLPGFAPFEITQQKGGIYLQAVWGGGYLSVKSSGGSFDDFQDPPKDPKQPPSRDQLVITDEKPHLWQVGCHGRKEKQAIQLFSSHHKLVMSAKSPKAAFSEFNLQKDQHEPFQVFHALPCGKFECEKKP